MNKILITLFLVVLASCNPKMYSTRSSGKDNTSFIIVLTEKTPYENIVVLIDGKSFNIEKVTTIKKSIKVNPIETTPGKHNIKIINKGEEILNENIFLGLQETKKIILK